MKHSIGFIARCNMKIGPKHVKMDKQGSISSLQPKKGNWDS